MTSQAFRIIRLALRPIDPGNLTAPPLSKPLTIGEDIPDAGSLHI